MLLLFYRIFTSTVWNTVRKTICCERCGTYFYYDMTRTAVGKGSAPYMIGLEAAKERAYRNAMKNLEKRLERDQDLVPCPSCFWVNQEAIRQYRRHSYGNAFLWIACSLLGTWALLFAVVMAGVFAHPNQQTAPPAVAIAIAILFLSSFTISPVLGLLIRTFLRSRINPNRSYPAWPALPAGTPVGTVCGASPTAAGGTAPAPMAAARTNAKPGVAAEDLTGWAAYLPGKLSLPQVCCVCLNLATTTYHAPLDLLPALDRPKVPLCSSCDTSLLTRWSIIVVALVTSVSLLALLLCQLWPQQFAGVSVGYLLLALGGSALATILVPNRFCQPYQLRSIDASRGVIALKAKNPGFYDVLVERASTKSKSRVARSQRV